MSHNSASFVRNSLFALILTASLTLLSASQPESALPSDSNFVAHPDWNEGCVKRLAAMQGQTCDLIFIGDSITSMFDGVGLETWNKYYAKRHALNFGAGGDKTQNVLFRLENWKVKDFNPKVAVILIGTNNIGDTVEDVGSGVKAVIAKTQQLYPKARVILVSILPRAGHAEKVEQLNAKLRTFADDSTVYFIDVAAKLTPEGDTWKGLGSDKLHLNPSGYAIWAETMEPLLSRLMGE